MNKVFSYQKATLSLISLLTSLFFMLPCMLLANDSLHGMESFFLSAEEAEQLHLSEAEWSMPPILSRGISKGPRIDVQLPIIKDESNPTLEAVSPLSMQVVFQENNGPVDMESLEVTAKKGFFSKSLTDRIKPFIEGTTLKTSGLKIPNGKFKIQISIADLQGNQTSSEYRLIITEK